MKKNMAFQLYIKPKVRKQLENLSEKDRVRVARVLEVIRDDPFSGKQLHGTRSGQYSFRVWPYRIVYRIEKAKLLVLVIAFGHRQGVY